MKGDIDIKRKILILVAVLLVIVLIIPLPITMYLYNLGFRVRVDNSTNYYDYIKTVHKDFIRDETSFISDKGQTLSGAFYRYPNKEYKALLVLPHGMGGGHDSYIAEIEYFAREGYLVFSYDNTGTNDSEGDNLKGLVQGPIDLNYALNYLETLPEINNLETMLYGHSWGGYSAASALNYEHDIKAVVIVSGFENTTNIIRQYGKPILGDKIELFLPYAKIYEKILFASNANLTGINGLKNTNANVMIVHSVDDTVVSYDNFIEYYNAFKDNKRFKFISLNDNGHNAVLENTARLRIQKIEDELEINPNNTQLIEEEKRLILEFNKDTMNQIVDFYNNNLK